MSDPSPHDAGRPSLWVRMIANGDFRQALIEDPLRALAACDDVAVSAEQVRALEAMSVDERAALLQDILREAHWRGGQARFGDVGRDGRLGGATDASEP